MTDSPPHDPPSPGAPAKAGSDSGTGPGPSPDAGPGPEWPTRLPARVFTVGGPPTMHGYDLHTDLARHYRFGELMLLGLTGEAPDEARCDLFDAVLCFAAPMPISEAATNAALLARTCGAPASSTAVVGAVTLAERVAEELVEYEPLLSWLLQPEGPLPDAFHSRDALDRKAVAAFATRVDAHRAALPLLDDDPTLTAALIAACVHCGLTRMEQLQTVLINARLPFIMAEILAHPAGDRMAYPLDVPAFAYTHDPGNSR